MHTSTRTHLRWLRPPSCCLRHASMHASCSQAGGWRRCRAGIRLTPLLPAPRSPVIPHAQVPTRKDIIHAVKGRRPARHATVTSERLAHNTRRDTTAAGGSSADVGADRRSAREPPAELGDGPVGTEASSRVWPADCRRSHGVARRPAHAGLYISARLRWPPDPRVATSALQSGLGVRLC